MPSLKGNALLFIFGTVCLDAIGLGIIIPVLPDLLKEVSDSGIGAAARWGGLLAAAYAIMQFVFGPLLGSLSDRFGRRRVLLVGLAALCIDYLIMGLAGSIALLLLGRLLAGAAGATIVTAKAYIADISSAENRAASFGMIGAAFGIGFILGPVIGGLLGTVGTRAPFFMAAALAALNFLYGYFVLPESLPEDKRRAFSWKKANPFSGILLIRKFPALGWVFLSFFLFQIAHSVYPTVWSYWGNAAFEWTSFEIGVSLAIVGIGFAVVQGWLIRKVIPLLGETRTAFIAFAFTILPLVFYGLVRNPVLVYISLPLVSLGALLTPALDGIMSNAVSDDEQGFLQGVSAGLVAIATVISPLLMTQIFYAFTAQNGSIYFPGAPFLWAAILAAGSAMAFRLGAGGDRRLDSRQGAKK